MKNRKARTGGTPAASAEDAERRWHELLAQCREEEKKLDQLFAWADAWDKAEKLRAFIRAYGKGLKKRGVPMGRGPRSANGSSGRAAMRIVWIP